MSELLYKKDWNETKNRFKSWWKRENTDRPLFTFGEHLSSPPTDLSLFASAKDKWLDIDKLLDREEKAMQLNPFAAETYPGAIPSLGPGSLGAFLGATPGFGYDTVWYDPCFKDVSVAEINFDKSNFWWQWTLEFIKKAIERGSGKYLVEMPDLVENLDTIAQLVGPEQLLFDLYDYPDEVHMLNKKINPIWFEIFETIYNLIKDEEGGMSFGYFNIYAPGKYAKLQCDFAAMISPDMFGEFAVPYLKEQADYLDYALYHIDGPEQLAFLDQLLTIDSIQAFQWVPLPANDPGSPMWDSLYRKILDAGKSLHLTMPVSRLESFFKRNGTQGIFVRTEPKDEKEAYDIINKSYNW